jgi:hypothetical protein
MQQLQAAGGEVHYDPASRPHNTYLPQLTVLTLSQHGRAARRILQSFSSLTFRTDALITSLIRRAIVASCSGIFMAAPVIHTVRVHSS